jgi:hypothetical protein
MDASENVGGEGLLQLLVADLHDAPPMLLERRVVHQHVELPEVKYGRSNARGKA